MTAIPTAPATNPPLTSARMYRPTLSQRVPFAPRAVLRRWRGAIGMIIGVGIALSLTMTILAVSTGTNALMTEDYQQSGADLYLYTKGSNPIPILAGETAGVIRQARHELTRVRAMPEVIAAIGMMPLELEHDTGEARRRGDAPSAIMAIGVDGDPTTIPHLIVLKAGRWPERPNEIAIGARVARQKDLAIGDILRLNGRDVTITGIGRLRAVSTYGSDSFVYVDYGTFRDRAGVGDSLSSILVYTDRPATVRQRAIEPGTLAAFTPADMMERVLTLLRSDQVTNWIMSAMALGIGALFVSSMLGRSVVERRLEFATLKAIGLPKRSILMLVTLEALVVCLVATLLGIVVSLLMGTWINTSIAEQYGFENLYRADIASFATVLALALALGLLAGLLPARRATRVDPVAILRES
ncbi:MAG: FtsX-like permease family protein [Chloroflexi bacterium]|nr:FtsX-like permease family protein [Chloroflexota bacterium]